ncbi:hypothetical protein ACFRCW_45755 [Streptomyces sp. NPDC056653]|uniref:hypothetical protein n=1 Tax=Streptomyces sp. NPDC056653 TaxID=3345894 RepID=UPI0036A3A966
MTPRDDARHHEGRAARGDHQRRGGRRVTVREVGQGAHHQTGDEDQEQQDEQGKRGHGRSPFRWVRSG